MDIPVDLLYIVASFHTKPRTKLLDWVYTNKHFWDSLKALDLVHIKHLLEAKPENINWDYSSQHPDLLLTIHLLERSLSPMFRNISSYNFSAIHIFEAIVQQDFETDVNQTHIHIKEKASKIDYVHL